MSKRRAGNELTRDNWDEEEEKVEMGKFQTADESVLKHRIVKKAKRMLQKDEFGEIKPIFSGFSGFNNVTNNANSKQAFSFLSKCNEPPSESGNHPTASTINSMTTSSSSALSENNCVKGSSPSIINPVKVMKLNEAFVKFITNAIQKNPYCVLTPALKDYEKQLSKFISIPDCKTNTFDSTMASSKDTPQISSFENTITLVKNSDEVKNNSVNTEKSSIHFSNLNSNTVNNGLSFNFGASNPVTKANELCNNNLKSDKTVEKPIKKENLEQKVHSVSSEESKNTPNSGFKLSGFQFNQQSFTSSLTNKTPEFAFNDKKTSSLSKTPGTTFNTPSFSFGTSIPAFTFKPMDQQNDKKQIFSFGSAIQTPVSDLNKKDEVQKSKDEDEDEDQPPIVNFTPIKENDAIFESKSKLYYLKDGKYEEHGIGQLYLKPINEKKIQLIMRSDNALGTIMVNTLLNESVNFTKRNEKNVQLICVLDCKAENPKPQTVLFKFKDAQITDLFENELSKLKN